MLAQETNPSPAEHPPRLAAPPLVETKTNPNPNTPVTANSLFWRRPTLAIAVAAMLFVCIGSYLTLARVGNHPAPASVSRDVLVAVVDAHDRCTAASTHSMPGVPTDSLPLTSKAIQKQFHETVLAADLIRDGWRFQSGRICDVAGRPAAHLIFSQSTAHLSVFSLPASSWRGPRDGIIRSECVNGHMIAVFARPSGVYCMVGFCPRNKMKLADVTNLLEKHQAEMVSAGVALHKIEGQELLH